MQLGGGAEEGGGAFDDGVQARLDEIAHFRGQRAHRAEQGRRLRDDIVSETGIEGADRDHDIVERVDVARDDRLDVGNDLRGDQHGIDRQVRLGGMAALAFDLDADAVGSGEQRAGAEREGADGHARRVVHAVDFLDAEPVHHAIIDHFPATAAALFGWLEDDRDGAVEITGLGEIFGGPQQHGGMAVMAAGMHLAVGLGGIGLAGDFGQRQRIHVGTQADDLARARLRALDDADDAGLADAGDDLVAAELLQLLGDDAGRAVHVELQLGMLVQVAPPGGDLVVQGGDPVVDGHDSLRTENGWLRSLKQGHLPGHVSKTC